MPQNHEFLATTAAQVASGVMLSVLWILFAVAHLSAFTLTGKISLLAVAVAETLVAVFFLIRTPPRTLSRNPREWSVAVLGTFLPLILRPTTATPIPAVEWCLLIGATIQAAGMLSLNRSFALVPAMRRLKTRGMYRVVRHPIYLSYLITHSCYLGANFSTWNLLIITGSVGLLVTRIHFEERHLSHAQEYRAYQTSVRWRLIPFLY